MYCKADSYQPERILFDNCFEDNHIASLRTQKEQAVLITQIMLHEMIHQYCAQKGIDDTAHSEAWQQKAEEHGLHSTYKDGNIAEEWLKPDVKALVGFQSLGGYIGIVRPTLKTLIVPMGRESVDGQKVF